MNGTMKVLHGPSGMYAQNDGIYVTGNQPKILLALGGWNHGSGRFSDMAHNDTKRATCCIETTIDILAKTFNLMDLILIG